jgi:hypothetical protein
MCYKILLNPNDWAGQVGPARSAGAWFEYMPICLGDDNFPNNKLSTKSKQTNKSTKIQPPFLNKPATKIHKNIKN